ncbi:COMM domain containing 5 Like Sm protein 4 [Lycorma delicatula]|uniref:COMM domain containing 5 Like Sm protein 4 n=1 Tax=Lycorma delicatula TaxID=130591 RepID=UPI003F514084
MPIHYATNDSINWRINIVISSRELGRVLKPVIYMEFKLDNGEVKCIEVPVGKFHLLRQNVALILKEMDLCKNKINNI